MTQEPHAPSGSSVPTGASTSDAPTLAATASAGAAPATATPPRPPRADARDRRMVEDPRNPHADDDLAEHDLSDHDERFFYGPSAGWPQLRRLGVALLVAGLAVLVLAAVHLATMSSGTIADATIVPDRQTVTVSLAEGESRMFYTERTSAGNLTNCTVNKPDGGRIGTTNMTPVILQGSDVLWHGQSQVTVTHAGDYLVRCESRQAGRQVRFGRPVSSWDVLGTAALAGIGGLATLVGTGLLIAGRRRGH